MLVMLLLSGLFTMAQTIKHEKRRKPKVEQAPKSSTSPKKETPKSSNSGSKKNQSKDKCKDEVKPQGSTKKKGTQGRTEKASDKDKKIDSKDKVEKSDSKVKDKKKDPFGNVRDKEKTMEIYKKNLHNNNDKKKSEINGTDIHKPTRSPKKVDIIQQVVNDMVYVDGGTFMMGATAEQVRDYNFGPSPHQETLSGYYINKYEVTQELWEAVMGVNPSNFKGDTHCPVEQVSWEDCQEFITNLNRLTGKCFRLPTEAEWEYAARGGKQSNGYTYSGSNNLDAVAWYESNSEEKTHPVGLKMPNELGLYDMSGNVFEWCQNLYDSHRNESQTNPKKSSDSRYICRGGGYYGSESSCKVSMRTSDPGYQHPNLGLRLAATSL